MKWNLYTPAIGGALIVAVLITAAVTNVLSAEPTPSIEIGLAELSPNGEAGGYAVPASGEAPPTFNGTCSMTVTDPITTGTDGSLTVTWSTGDWERLDDLVVKRCSLGTNSCSDATWDSGSEWVTVVNPSDRCDLIALGEEKEYVATNESKTQSIFAKTAFAGGGGGGGSQGEDCTFPEDGTTQSLSAKASALSAGPYKYRAGVDLEVDVPSTAGYGSHSHTHTETAYCTDTVRIESAPSPELIGSSIPPYAYAISTGVQLSFRVTNYGSLPAGASSAIIDVDTNNDGVANWSSNVIAVAGLASDASATVQNALANLWTTPATGQTVRARVRVDTAGVVAEANETNNTSPWEAVTIQDYDVTARPMRANGAEITGGGTRDYAWPTGNGSDAFAVGSFIEGIIKVKNERAFPVSTPFQMAFDVDRYNSTGGGPDNFIYENNVVTVNSLNASEDRQVTTIPSGYTITQAHLNQEDMGNEWRNADFMVRLWADSNQNISEGSNDNIHSNTSGNNDSVHQANFRAVQADLTASVSDQNGATAGYWGPFAAGSNQTLRFSVRNNSRSCWSASWFFGWSCNSWLYGVVNTPFQTQLEIDTNGDCVNSSALNAACAEFSIGDIPAYTISRLSSQTTQTINVPWSLPSTLAAGTYRARIYTDSTFLYDERGSNAGLDESDNRTDWQSFTVTAGSPAVVLQGCNATTDAGACGAASAGWKNADFGIASGHTLKLRWDSSGTTGGSCTTSFGGGTAIDSALTGVDVVEPTSGNPSTYTISCNSNPPGTPGTDNLTVSVADVSITVNKGTVRAGDTIELMWDTGVNFAEACTVSSTGTSYTQALSAHEDCTVGTACQGSHPIMIEQSTVFTLNCGVGGSDTVEVNLVPQVYES